MFYISQTLYRHLAETIKYAEGDSADVFKREVGKGYTILAWWLQSTLNVKRSTFKLSKFVETLVVWWANLFKIIALSGLILYNIVLSFKGSI